MTTKWLIAVPLLAASSATAQPTVGDETIIVIDKAPERVDARDRERALGDAPFVTVIHPDEHSPTASVADAIGASVGAQSRSLGGLGAFESITVRGAAPGHTSVLVDGVPLARIAAVTTDLGRFSLGSFGEVELYRGAVPVELGGAGVGGVLNLVTRLGRGEHGENLRASIGGGSFGARHLRAWYGDAHGAWRSSTTLGYQGADGDYSYFHNNGTPLNANDDSYQIRRNNGFDAFDAATRIGKGERDAAGLRFVWKRQGLPGSMTSPSLRTSLNTLDTVVDGRIDHQVGRLTARELAYALVELQRLRDPDGELGLGPQRRAYVTLSGGASSAWSAALDRHRATAGLELRGDHFTDHDDSGARGELAGNRVAMAGLAAFEWVPDRAGVFAITPAVRYDAVRTRATPMTEGPDAFAPQPARWDLVASPRLTARAAVREDLSIKGSAGRYVRLPTLVELFGDRGVIVGTPGLRAERGTSLDLGAVWAPDRALGRFDRIFVEAAGFATRTHDTIAFVMTAGYAARAINIADAQSYGAELVASTRIAKRVSLTANYTHLSTEQLSPEVSFDGKSLPRQPTHSVYARAEVAADRATLWLDGSYQSIAFLDQGNFQRVPARLLAGTGARVSLTSDLAVSLAVENLADTRIEYLPLDRPPRPDLANVPTALADVAGFPLPGRTLYVSLDWSHR